MRHALVVGGTGMLANVSLWLMEQGYHVSVIARNPYRMEKLQQKACEFSRLTPLLVDYQNEKLLQNKLTNTIHDNGKIELVVAWIHSIAEHALDIICEEAAKGQDAWKLVHILGSSSNLAAIKKHDAVPDNCLYRQVQLGFILENGGSRWLTNKEIADGVIKALQNENPISIVGVLEPWEKRP
ncbi:short-chain dehydrogenase [Bacillaceae bacterium Marseille-Q3522]|nr:short-chain dehydrogenase [Bacillaceae bacterium Marseille-Q3522]